MTGIHYLRTYVWRIAPLIAGASLSCGDPIRPSEVAEVYVLERVGSDSVPAVYYRDETLHVRVLADTLRLFENGRGKRTGLVEYEALQGGDGTTSEVPVDDEFTYEVKYWRVEIAFECDDTGSCIAPPHFIARLTSGELRVEYALGGKVPLIYRAVEG